MEFIIRITLLAIYIARLTAYLDTSSKVNASNNSTSIDIPEWGWGGVENLVNWPH
jgi:hypothetical protein